MIHLLSMNQTSLLAIAYTKKHTEISTARYTVYKALVNITLIQVTKVTQQIANKSQQHNPAKTSGNDGYSIQRTKPG